LCDRGRRPVKFVRLALKVFKQNDEYFVEVTLLYPLIIRLGRFYRQSGGLSDKKNISCHLPRIEPNSWLVHPVG
jgi:hypothetical protein